MATLNASKWGRLGRVSQTSHSAARDGTTATSTISNPSYSTIGVEYRKAAGRGSTTYSIYRSYFYFDTSSITSTVSSASIVIAGWTYTNGDVIVVPSTAFAGDGSSNLVSSDYDNVSYNVNYGNEVISWSTGSNSIALKSTALSDIQNNNYFICAIINYDYDYLDSEPGSTLDDANGINFASTAYLDYTVTASGPANISSLNGVSSANLGKIMGNEYSNIDSINTVS